ncbi:MAG: hypothetical protein J5841_01245 [Clostridia bacterium]|nr:hypothetical protein [Clostridia bacterium]
MPDKCIRCGGPSAYPIRALEVRTLPVRGLGGERKIQALGDEKQGGVCERCAHEQLILSLDPVRAAKPLLIRFGAVFAAGLLIEALTFLFLKDNRQVFLLLGIAALICCVLGIYDVLKKAKEKSAALRALPEKKAMEAAAWDVYLDSAPKKENENDLSYIPINEETLARKNGDLMVLYHLLPEIAVEAWNKIHKGDKTDDPSHCHVQDQG